MDPKSQLILPPQLAADDSQCLVRCTSEQHRTLERLLYCRYPHEEWGTFFRFGYRKTSWGLVICFVDLLPPSQGDFDPKSPLVEFSPGYINRALSTFDEGDFGIGFIHSHPQGCRPTPSRSDDDMDAYFATEFEKFSNGRPFVSLIASRDADHRRTFSGRCVHQGHWLPVTDWLTCGSDVLRRERSLLAPIKLSDECADLERVTQLLGESSAPRLGNTVVGIVGCSGLGTPVGHVLARSGVGEFVLVDVGFFKKSNHERNHASRASDLPQSQIPKVELLKRLIHEIRPSAKVTCLQADVLDDEVLDQLVRCDLVLGCTDSYYARAALGDIATHFSVPVLDLAVQMGSKDGALTTQTGEIARYMPGLPCPWCRNRVNAVQIRAETASNEERAQARAAAQQAKDRGEDGAPYWIGDHPQELTVGYMTSVVGALGAGYAHNWITGAATMPHNRMQFDIGKTAFGFVDDDERQSIPDCSCSKCVGFADQGKAYFTVSRR